MLTKFTKNLIGKSIHAVLENSPYKDWAVYRSEESGLPETRVYYEFPNQGFSLESASNEIIRSIFIKSPKNGGYFDEAMGIAFNCTRQDVVSVMDSLMESGEGFEDPILGNHGPWYKFELTDYYLHIQFESDVDYIKMITLMEK